MHLLLFNLATDASDPVLGFTIYWIEALAQRVDKITVITMRAGKADLPENVSVYSAGKEKTFSEFRRALEFYRHLCRILYKEKIDVCFSHMIPIFTVMAAPLLKSGGIPIVTWYAHRKVTTLVKLAHWVSKRVVTNIPTGYQYRSDKLEIIGHGIDTDLFAPKQRVEEKGPPFLLCVGRLSPIKDDMTLIEAVNLLRGRGHELECMFVGEAPERDRIYGESLRKRVNELHLNGAIRFVGDLVHKDVLDWYHRCFAHVNLSPTGALDKAVLEAMACGKPSLVANDGFREALGWWSSRLIFRHGEPISLAEKIEGLLGLKQSEREHMGVELREAVIRGHSLQRLANCLVEIFEEIRCSRARQ